MRGRSELEHPMSHINLSKPTVVVLGMMGRAPFAGVAWQVLHYLEGFRRAGCDVYYVEDTGDWPYDPEQNSITADCHYTVTYINRLMEWCGLPNRWAYRAAAQENRMYGLSQAKVTALFARADVLVNLTGATVLRAEHMRVPSRVYLETDPVLPQIEVAQGRTFTIDLLASHTHHFTFGENVGSVASAVPTGPFKYLPTRQPVVLDWWHPDAHESTNRYTTISNWKQTGKDIEWNGELYTWSKHHEFEKFIALPQMRQEQFELALATGDRAVLEMLSKHGWQVIDALGLSREILPYRDYILKSKGEFTVAKDQNIRLRSGWFSDRSACYLAAAKPVITQDTGFDSRLPTGEGLFAFTTLDEILVALDAINSDYPRHCRAAREIAEEYFRAETVIGRLLGAVGF